MEGDKGNFQITTVRLKSVKDFVAKVCDLRDGWIEGSAYFDPWFRGQTQASWAPEPGIFRHELLQDEDEIRDQFERRALQFMTELPPQNYWGWYFLMQHYGAPTRLLDWTDSALIALFFALNSDSKYPQDKEDSIVWMLNPWWLNGKVLGHEEILLAGGDAAEPYLAKPYVHVRGRGHTQIQPQYPVAIDPPYIARRIAVQKSHFTIFGHDRQGLVRLAEEDGAQIAKLLIAKEHAPRMRADLGTLGITDTSVYPDLRGLSDELIRYRLGDWPVY